MEEGEEGRGEKEGMLSDKRRRRAGGRKLTCWLRILDLYVGLRRSRYSRELVRLDERIEARRGAGGRERRCEVVVEGQKGEPDQAGELWAFSNSKRRDFLLHSKEINCCLRWPEMRPLSSP